MGGLKKCEFYGHFLIHIKYTYLNVIIQWPQQKMTPSPWVVFGISHILYILYAWFNPSNQIFMEFVNQSRKNQPDTSTKSGEIFV